MSEVTTLNHLLNTKDRALTKASTEAQALHSRALTAEGTYSTLSTCVPPSYLPAVKRFCPSFFSLRAHSSAASPACTVY